MGVQSKQIQTLSLGAVFPGERRHVLDIWAKCWGRAQRKGWSILSQSSGKINKKIPRGGSVWSESWQMRRCLFGQEVEDRRQAFQAKGFVRAKAGSYETT